MTLNLDWSKVKDYENVCEMDDPERPGHRTSTPMVFVMGILMMHTGISHIREQDADEFYMRAHLVEACMGGGLLQKVQEVDGERKAVLVGITPEDVYAHIGLRSNVSSYTPAQFFKHLREDVAHELRQHYRSVTRHHRDDALKAMGRHVGQR